MFERYFGFIKTRKVVLLFVFIFIALGSCLGVVQNVGAASGDYWSWTDKTPLIYESVDAKTSDRPSDCTGSIQIKKVYNDPVKKRMCVDSNESLSFGAYLDGGMSTISTFIGFSFDTSMYRLEGMCTYHHSCRYLPESDTLIERRVTGIGYFFSLRIYNNFTNRLSINIQPGVVVPDIYFSFNLDKPDYVFVDNLGNEICINAVGPSKNGKWLAVEFANAGFGLLNLDTYEMKYVSLDVLRYFVGSNPDVDLSVSNDGRHVAVMGFNSGFSLIDVNEDCGQEYFHGVYDSAKLCKKSNFDPATLTLGFNTAYMPSYSDDGGELRVFAMDYLGRYKNIILRANGYGGQKLDYLALGDSYSSGEGETSDGYYLNATNDPYEKCHLSSRSYPYLIAGSSLTTINPINMKSVACSGALIGDIYGNDGYKGQENRLLRFDDPNVIDNLQQDALDSFLPGRRQQIDFIQKYHPKVITVGVGGNDVGFAVKVRACIMPDVCKIATDATEKARHVLEIKGMYSQLTALYAKLHHESSGSKIFAVGYPRIVEPDGICSRNFNTLLNNDERRFVDESVKYLNEVIRAAARDAGIGYLDIENSQGGHLLCGAQDPTSMNFIRTGDDFNPVINADWAYILGQESFHPNPFGHLYTANSILSSIGDITVYDYCSDGSVICPESTDAPEPSGYWSVDGLTNTTAGRFVNFVQNVPTCEMDLVCRLTLSSMSLSPISDAQIVINSEPRLLGVFTVADDGSLDIEVKLPNDLEEGYHIIHIYGKSYAGESIDLYQGVKYLKPVDKQDDQINGNTPNSQVGSDAKVLESTTSDIEKPVAVKNEDQVLDQERVAENAFESDTFENPGGVLPKFLEKSPDKDVVVKRDEMIGNSILYYSLGLAGFGAVLYVFIKQIAKNK